MDGFSLSDIINDYRNRTEQLSTFLTGPFGSGCESTNPNSTINCNEAPFPSLLFNGAANNTTWGYGGKGLIFADNNNLVNDNPQLATAKRGDTLNYSMEIETQRYNDAEMASPVTQYVIYSLFSEGLTANQESIVIKVDGQTLGADEYRLEVTNFDEMEGGAIYSSLFGGAKSAFYLMLNWNNGNGSFYYDEDAAITITYSASIKQDAPGEVYSRGAYLSDMSSLDYLIFQSTDHQANALIDGNILIRRVDADGNPLAGAKYTIDGVRADIKDEADNHYVFDNNGAASTFTTNSNGAVLISGLPMGKYAVREVYSPDGHPVESDIVEKEVYNDVTTIEYGEVRWEANNPIGINDFTDYINSPMLMDDGRILVPTNVSAFGLTDDIVYQYDEYRDSYYNSERQSAITKNGNSFHLKETGDGSSFEHDFVYDSSLGKLIAHRDWLDVFDYSDALYYLELDGGHAYVRNGNDQYALTYNKDGDFYDGASSSGALALKKDGDGYRLEAGQWSIPYSFDSKSGKYLKDLNIYIYVLESVTDSEAIVRPYYAMSYSPVFDHYYICLGSNEETIVRKERSALLASEFLFRDRISDGVSEAILNPQTSDTIAKAVGVAIAVPVVALIVRRQLARR